MMSNGRRKCFERRRSTKAKNWSVPLRAR